MQVAQVTGLRVLIIKVMIDEAIKLLINHLSFKTHLIYRQEHKPQTAEFSLWELFSEKTLSSMHYFDGLARDTDLLGCWQGACMKKFSRQKCERFKIPTTRV